MLRLGVVATATPGGGRSQVTLYAGGGNNWYGPSVWKSTDDGATWTQSSAGMTYGDGEDQPKISTIWKLADAASNGAPVSR